MNYIKKRALAITMLCLVFCSVLPQSVSIWNLKEKYDVSLGVFTSFQLMDSLHKHEAMVQLFACFDQTAPALIKQLRADIKVAKKGFKKSEALAQGLHEKLQSLHAYIKKHKMVYDAMLYHRELRGKYQELLDMVAEDQGIIPMIDKHRAKFDILQEDTKFLDTFLKNVRQASYRISEFEDCLHADYVDVKLTNYVFKIDLIRLRNSILFDKQYRDKK